MESHVRRKRQLEIYRKFMNIAKTSMTEKHASHLKDLEASDHMPMGRVSSRVYDSIWNDRTFDKYFRLVPQRMNKKQQMLANMKATFAKQGDKSSGDSSYGSNKNAMINEMLQTKKEAIGGYQLLIDEPRPGLGLTRATLMHACAAMNTHPISCRRKGLGSRASGYRGPAEADSE
mmetsp:Transcript_61643/g.169515  ORF Transcript_61643/g.169515 Transcript_61643/m.169515 type:complete len:175 (+) Transcript_61643:247-771(+)